MVRARGGGQAADESVAPTSGEVLLVLAAKSERGYSVGSEQYRNVLVTLFQNLAPRIELVCGWRGGVSNLWQMLGEKSGEKPNENPTKNWRKTLRSFGSRHSHFLGAPCGEQNK